MKSPDEIKKGLECCYGNEERRFCEMCPFGVKTDEIYPTFECSDFDAVGEYALSLIQQLQDQNASLKSLVTAAHAEIADLDTEVEELHDRIPRWISVEERLPEYDIDVLVCATGDFGSVITITSYSDHLHGFNIKGWVSPWQYFHKNYTITHWMPIPQPPEEE